ncbi:MAG: hypothetical protein J3Q66DRAFT_393090 [Benniella sp.]|nr:MAG: hypothetical protein J3Q66DRAFT_393090 [Benniella sp.]
MVILDLRANKSVLQQQHQQRPIEGVQRAQHTTGTTHDPSFTRARAHRKTAVWGKGLPRRTHEEDSQSQPARALSWTSNAIALISRRFMADLAQGQPTPPSYVSPFDSWPRPPLSMPAATALTSMYAKSTHTFGPSYLESHDAIREIRQRVSSSVGFPFHGDKPPRLSLEEPPRFPCQHSCFQE